MKKITLLCAILVSQLLFSQTVPTIDCPMNINVPVLGGSCDSIVTFNDAVANDAEDGTLTVTQTMGLPSGSSFPLGDTIIEFSTTDSDNNTESCQFTITVEDNQAPIALCQNFTLQLDSAGMATLDPSDIDAGSFDTCGVASLSVSRTDFTCADLLTSIDAPLLITGIIDGPLVGGQPKGIEVYALADIPDLSIFGVGSANNGGGTDGEEFTFPAVAVTAGTYLAVANESIGFFNFFGFFPDYTDNSLSINGNDAVELFLNGTVIDVFGDINTDGIGESWEYTNGWAYRQTNNLPSTVFNPADWTYSGIDALDGETSNNTAANPFPIASYTFTPTMAGPTTVTLTVTDTSGNTSTCDAQVTIEDMLVPSISCPDAVTAVTDVDSCTATGVVLGMATAGDNCGVESITNDAPAAFPQGITMVTWTATDTSGNTATCTQMVTVNDAVIPNAVCQNIIVQLDATGMITILPQQVDGGSTDNCEIASMLLSNDTFTCDDIGSNNVALTVTDNSGNINACVVEITVEDNLAPIVACQNITVMLDATGNVTVDPSQIDNNSTDNCAIDSYALSQTDFTCDNIGENTVTLTVTDVNGNSSECTATVTIFDDMAPTAVCLNFTVSIGDDGLATVLPTDIDNESSDNCEVASLELDITTFTCDDLGDNTVTLTITDTSGNSSTCSATVTVVDTTGPVVECLNLELELDANGMASIVPSDAVISAEDGCGVDFITVSQDTFTCDDIGENQVIVTVTDDHGNETECTAIITIVDNTLPELVCQNITLSLDENGMAVITTEDINEGLTDNCGIDTIEIDINSFTCDDVGENEVTLSVVDTNGNMAECVAIVTIVDDMAPVILCQDITINLDGENGTVEIDASQLDGGSTDNCGISSIVASTTTFDCSNVGENIVTLTVTDINGNESQCEATVTVTSTDAPVATCQNISVILDENGQAFIEPGDIYSGNSATCNLSIDISTFTCDDVGTPLTVTLTSTSTNGDETSCTALVNVVDNIDPIIICPEETVIIAALTPYELPDFVADGTIQVIDNCTSNMTIVQDPPVGTFVEEGETDIIITAIDPSGNEVTCEFTIFVDPSLDTNSYAAQLNTISLYPNPASSFIVLENPNNLDLKNAKLTDLTGRVVKQFDLTRTSTERILDISEIASASYFLNIEGTEGTISFQVIKR